MDFEKLIRDCDAYVRAGEDQKVVRAIADIDIPSVPRQWRLPLATLCRRVAQIPLGLKILSFVTSSARGAAKPTSHELAEYAALLQKFGAVDDSLRLLAKVDAREVPEALMYRAVCHFSRWEYPAAVPLLEKFVLAATSPYQALVGKVNLAAALLGVHRLADAESLLQDNIQIARGLGALRLEGNCHELLTQVHLLEGDLKEANLSLSVAESLLSGPGSLDRLFTNKCRAFLTALETRSVAPIQSFRTEAMAWPHPETVRECDLYSLLIEPNEELHEKLYFGTPFSFYRSRMRQLLSREPEANHYTLGSAGGRLLDIASGEESGGKNMKPGSMTHKVMNALLRDFYRPARMGSLFGQLFPGEHFDIHSSPARVHQALRRARIWLEENAVPAKIVETEGAYSLQLESHFAIRLPLERELVGRSIDFLAKIEGLYPRGETFTAQSARERLGLSSSAFHRLLRPLVEDGRIEKYGASGATVYFISVKRSA